MSVSRSNDSATSLYAPPTDSPPQAMNFSFELLIALLANVTKFIQVGRLEEPLHACKRCGSQMCDLGKMRGILAGFPNYENNPH